MFVVLPAQRRTVARCYPPFASPIACCMRASATSTLNWPWIAACAFFSTDVVTAFEKTLAAAL